MSTQRVETIGYFVRRCRGDIVKHEAAGRMHHAAPQWNVDAAAF